jgi:phosphate/phosphite/phosphonate ABC transporter binding protein
MLERLNPLAQLLSEYLHCTVEVVLAKDFQDYEKRLKNGQFDIAFSNPTHYAKTSDANEVIAIQTKGRESRLRGLIIVRADSNISSAQDLIGRPVAIVSWESTAGYLSQKVFLEAQGIQPATHLKLQEAYDNKQENVILSVYHGDVDAGFINEDALHIVDAYIPSQQIRIIERTSWLPNWAISLKRTLPVMVKTRIQQAILGMKSGDPTLQALKVDGFVSATDADYDVVRRALDLTMPVR